MPRYSQLVPIIQAHKPKTILEIGTWNGHRAIAMASVNKDRPLHYIGLDSFSGEGELNPTLESVTERLESFVEQNKNFTFELHKELDLSSVKPDLALLSWQDGLIDKTLLQKLAHIPIIAVDGYCDPAEEGNGCNELIDSVADSLVLPDADPRVGGGTVRLALIPKTAWPGKVNLQIKTKNCVPDENIQANIHYNISLIKNWVVQCANHDKTAILCSGGPSFKDLIPEIKKKARRKNTVLFTVKSAHDHLIEKGVIPWACVLLDPRAHVVDFIETPHPDVRYFVASMCHPTTIDNLLQKNARVYGYHALVGAGEDQVVKQRGGGSMIGGGSTAAVRAISVLSMLGFRKFDLYGYDSCYEGKPEKTHGVKEKEAMKVNVSGRDFWTDAELVAQAQDFERLLKEGGHKGIDLNVHGDGMIQHIWTLMSNQYQKFEDVYA